jgi:hypothetical protein
MKIDQEKPVPVPTQPRAAAAALSRNTRRHLSVVCSLALAAALLCCPGAVQAGDAAPANGSVSQPAPVLKSPAEPKGHQMQRYQAFAREAELPLIEITNETTLAVGTAVKADTSRLAELSARDLAALAGQFAVPTAVIAKVIQRVAANSELRATRLAQELRTAVVDYRFLHGEWDRYHPQQENQQTRTDALQALQAGDIAKAWVLYDNLGLPSAPGSAPPAPPTNLHVNTDH